MSGIRRHSLPALLLVVALFQIGAGECTTSPPPIRDTGFDLWCGDHLCLWKVVRGDVARVGTWHGADSGVEFRGGDTAIQQFSEISGNDGTCIEFKMIANVEETAEVYLSVDVYGDGVVERVERIPTSHWREVSFLLNLSQRYDGIRFELSKRGSGHAVLAQIAAKFTSGCTGLGTVPIDVRPDGAGCLFNEDCDSGLCRDATQPVGGFLPLPISHFEQVCVSCDPAAPACDANQTCGVIDPLNPALGASRACVAIGSHVLGDACITNDECASGICFLNVCSACNAATDCGPGGECSSPGPGVPLVCNPHQGKSLAGAGCVNDSDCTSGHCNGTPAARCAIDGRPCLSTADCPRIDNQTDTECVIVGVQGGSCE